MAIAVCYAGKYTIACLKKQVIFDQREGKAQFWEYPLKVRNACSRCLHWMA